MELSLNINFLKGIKGFFKKYSLPIIIYTLVSVSVGAFLYYYFNGLGLAYNDARSHLDIGRRVVEGLKPGMAQLGSVWLPLPHLLMIPTIWNDFMWHSGLAGAIISMISFVITGVLIYKFLENLNVGIFGRLVGVIIFASNLNILYLQSTAMTELLLLAVMTAGVYELMLWHKTGKVLNLLKAAFWIMLSTLTRYDGWFLFAFTSGLVVFQVWRKNNFRINWSTFNRIEGTYIFFATLASLGVFLWFLWNLLIFKDPLYFAFGPYSAHSQQDQLDAAGILDTKGNIFLSVKHYLYALVYNSNLFLSILGFLGAMYLWFSKRAPTGIKFASTALTAPLLFNIIALFLGHSVLFIQGISGNTWFNVRYGIMMMPSIAIFAGLLTDRLSKFKYMIFGLILMIITIQFTSYDAVTIDDARVGSSQKNVSEVSGWLGQNAKDKEGFILISAASHDAIIFSSGLPMKKYIHEGTGKYWESATTNPERWARWIIMRSYDDNDSTWKAVSRTPDISSYNLVQKYPFADIYELKPEFLPNLNTKPVLGKQK